MLRSPFLQAVIVLVVFVRFHLFGPPRENGCCSFGDKKAKQKRLHTTLDNICRRIFLTFSIKVIESYQTCVFSYLLVPWQETFADAGDGEGGVNRDQYLFHPTPNIRFVLVL